jgi:hypothetical protein
MEEDFLRIQEVASKEVYKKRKTRAFANIGQLAVKRDWLKQL